LVMAKGHRPRRAGALDDTRMQAPEIEYASGTGLLLRMFWMGVGNLLLVYLAGSIARVPPWSLTWRDIAYGITVVALVTARYLDVARYDGLTINSAPATQVHVRRYAVALFVIASAIWGLAQSFEA
jgi:hypothetical protein